MPVEQLAPAARTTSPLSAKSSDGSTEAAARLPANREQFASAGL